jgi:hypothetical protein
MSKRTAGVVLVSLGVVFAGLVVVELEGTPGPTRLPHASTVTIGDRFAFDGQIMEVIGWHPHKPRTVRVRRVVTGPLSWIESLVFPKNFSSHTHVTLPGGTAPADVDAP